MKQWIWIALFGVAIAGLLNGLQLTGVGRAHAFVGPDPHVIPHDALRFRVIANSNSALDQHVKREVRDEVIAYVGARMASIRTPLAAAQELRRLVPAVERLATATLRKAGVSYAAQTTFGPAPFPTKLYGNRVYPAGTYQALRITLGRGQGQNWWCVLFPPLCFVALSDGDAVAATKAFPDYPPLAVTSVPNPNGHGRIPVQLRLAVVDYGEEALKVLTAEFQNVWRSVVRTA